MDLLSTSKKWILAVTLALWATTAQAQTHVQSVTETTDQFSGDATVTLTLSATGVGNTGFLVVLSNQNRSVSAVNSCGGTWVDLHRSGTTTFAAIWGVVFTSSVTTCSVVLTGNSDAALPDSVTFIEFSGGASTLTETGTSTGFENTTTTTTHTATDVTPSAASSIFVCGQVYAGSTGGLTADAAFTQAYAGTTGSHRWVGYRIQSGSTTAQNCANTTVTSRASRGALAAVDAVAAGGGCTGGMMLLGAGKCE